MKEPAPKWCGDPARFWWPRVATRPGHGHLQGEPGAGGDDGGRRVRVAPAPADCEVPEQPVEGAAGPADRPQQGPADPGALLAQPGGGEGQLQLNNDNSLLVFLLEPLVSKVSKLFFSFW